MAPKRNVKAVCVTNNNNNNYTNLDLNDVLCPICRSILIEPVTLPCNHGFCYACFDGTVANTNLVCPLCRVRIASWLRKSSKNDSKPVNNDLWEAIQKTFPVQVKNKLAGIDEFPQEEPPRRLTAPGEIRREYELQRAKELLELQREREAEAKASEQYIKKLREDEERLQSIQQENLRLSEQVAKQLSKEYCFDPGPSCSKAVMQTPSSSKKQQLSIASALKKMGQRKLTLNAEPELNNSFSKKYTCKILCQDQSKMQGLNKVSLINLKLQDKLKKFATEGEACDSNDSIASECRYFKPIDQRIAPVETKEPVLRVIPKFASSDTVIIGSPRGKVDFKHASVGSAFVFFKIPVDTTLIPNNETVTCQQSLCSVSEQRSKSTNSTTPKKQIKSKVKASETKNSLPSKSLRKSRRRAASGMPKRKRSRSRAVSEKKLPSKRLKLSIDSPPFYGFDNKSLDELKVKTNGAIMLEPVNISGSSVGEGNSLKLKQLQEEEDFKLAQKLHEELNCSSRYSTRNNVSVQTKSNPKKPPARQVTLKEIISQTMSKVP